MPQPFTTLDRPSRLRSADKTIFSLHSHLWLILQDRSSRSLEQVAIRLKDNRYSQNIL